MSELAKIPGLVRRGNVWIYRQRVPKDLVSVLGKRELKATLRTETHAEAKPLAIRQAEANQRLFESARRDRPRGLPSSLAEAEARIIQFVHASVDELKATEVETWRGSWQEEERFQEEGAVATFLEDGGSQEAATALASFAAAVFGSYEALDHFSDEDRNSAYSLLLGGLREVQNRRIEVFFPRRRLSLPRHPPFVGSGLGSYSLDKVIQEYLEDYEARGTHAPKGKASKRASYRIIRQFFGDILIEQVTRKRCRDFQQFLNRMPSNLGKLPGTTALSLVQAADAARAEGHPCLARATQHTYLLALQMLMKWAVDEGLIATNPAASLQPLGAKTFRRDARLPFEKDHLTAIFNAPLYTGCVDDQAGYAQIGPNRPRGTRFWLPLIALFTGMRLNEICQLEVTDVCLCDGILCIRVEANPGSDKMLKNGYARRTIPIHPELSLIGFPAFVERRRAEGQTKLFPDLRLSPGGHRSERASRWFNEGFLPKYIEKGPKLTFHSFRHGFRDALSNAGTPIEAVDSLGGWHTLIGSSTTYGGPPSIQKLAEHVEKVQFPGLNLSHLRF